MTDERQPTDGLPETVDGGPAAWSDGPPEVDDHEVLRQLGSGGFGEV